MTRAPNRQVEALRGIAKMRGEDTSVMDSVQLLAVMETEPEGLAEVAREMQRLEAQIQQTVAEIVHITR